jgi:hypothetical protein
MEEGLGGKSRPKRCRTGDLVYVYSSARELRSNVIETETDICIRGNVQRLDFSRDLQM